MNYIEPVCDKVDDILFATEKKSLYLLIDTLTI